MKKQYPYKDVKVLLMEASSRAALPMARGFHNLGCRVTTVAETKLAVGILTRFADEKIVVKEIDSNEEVAEKAYTELLGKEKYDLVVPLSDFSATVASKNKTAWEATGAKIAVNDWSVFGNIIDKSRTMKICEENDIPAPKTLFSDNPVKEVEDGIIDFPIVVKPKTGIGSIGFNIVRDMETLKRILADYDDQNGPLLVQEYVEQGDHPQYGAELFRDRDGRINFALIAKVPRWYPVDGGSRLCSVSVHDEKIAEDCKRLLDALNWNGYANIDLVWDEKKGEAKILEINGRTGASVKLDFLAGIDVSRLILENELGYETTVYDQYADGKAISCFLVDCLWFLKSKKRFKTKPSWFARWKYKDVVFSWGDPIPSFGFLILSIRNFRKEMNKRKRIET